MLTEKEFFKKITDKFFTYKERKYFPKNLSSIENPPKIGMQAVFLDVNPLSCDREDTVNELLSRIAFNQNIVDKNGSVQLIRTIISITPLGTDTNNKKILFKDIYNQERSTSSALWNDYRYLILESQLFSESKIPKTRLKFLK